MNNIMISICIPTYNRKNELKRLLESLESDFNNEQLEIIINDNCSNDGTEEMIHRIQKNTSCIKYKKNDRNYGFDYNLNQCVLRSSGKFIWFLGSDDLVIEGAVKKLIKNITENENIYILEGNIVDKNGLLSLRAGLEGEDNELYEKTEENLCTYIDDIKNDISYLFAFISSIVVKREDYIKIKTPTELKNSAYDHMYILLKITSGAGNIRYLKEPYYEAGINENDWNDVRGKHFFLDITSLHKFIKNIYKDSKNEIKIRESVGKLFQRNSCKFNMIYNIYYSKQTKQLNKLENSIDYFYINNFKYKICKIFLANSFIMALLNFLRKIKKRFKI